MSCFLEDTILSEIVSDAPISDGTAAYLESRAASQFYDYVLTKFKDAETNGLTKTKLAHRLRKGPDHISKWLRSPANWTIGTVALLLAGISHEELLPYSTSFLGRPNRNMRAEDVALANADPRPSGGTTNLIDVNQISWHGK